MQTITCSAIVSCPLVPPAGLHTSWCPLLTHDSIHLSDEHMGRSFRKGAGVLVILIPCPSHHPHPLPPSVYLGKQRGGGGVPESISCMRYSFWTWSCTIFTLWTFKTLAIGTVKLILSIRDTSRRRPLFTHVDTDISHMIKCDLSFLLWFAFCKWSKLGGEKAWEQGYYWLWVYTYTYLECCECNAYLKPANVTHCV